MSALAFDLPDMVTRLGAVEHFRGLSPDELHQIITAGTVHHVAKDQIIFGEGDLQAGLHVLLMGRVQVCKHSPSGQVSILTILDPVIMFNEVAALDGGVNPVTTIAITDCMLWQLSADKLEALILRYPRVGLGMLHVLAARNRNLVGAFGDLSFRSVMSRCAKLLLEISADGQQPIDRRKHPNQQLAARIATVPEAFSRALRTFKDAGDIIATPKQISVLNAERLRCVADMTPLSKPTDCA